MSKQIRDSYIIDILQMLKNLAMHDLFMQRIRQQLADNSKFDPFTAFKLIDSFKHNMIISIQLQGFLEHLGYDVSTEQCQQCIQSLNKSKDSLNYDRFIQMIMPYDLKRRNLSMTRYNKLEVGIGMYEVVNQVICVTREVIGKFFVKEIQFIRNFGDERKYFCQKWGGDIYTISQMMFKNKNKYLHNNVLLKNPLYDYQNRNNIQRQRLKQQFIREDIEKQIDFQNFYEFCRLYKCYFNKQEFKSIWRRIKTVQERIILKPQQIFIKQQDLVNFLLVKNFNTKLKYASKYDIPLKSMNLPPPSYKLPISDEMIHNSMKYRRQQQQQYFDTKLEEIKKQANDRLFYKMKSFCSYPELQLNTISPMLKQKQQQWKDVFGKMSDYMIDERYRHIIQRQKNSSLNHHI